MKGQLINCERFYIEQNCTFSLYKIVVSRYPITKENTLRNRMASLFSHRHNQSQQLSTPNSSILLEPMPSNPYPNLGDENESSGGPGASGMVTTGLGHNGSGRKKPPSSTAFQPSSVFGGDSANDSIDLQVRTFSSHSKLPYQL